MERSKLRAIAVRVLTSVLSDGETLESALSKQKFADEDRAWLMDVCAGTLRWKGRLDWVIDAHALKKKPTGKLRKYLLIACYQIIVQDQVHAGLVVSEVVSEIKSAEGVHPAGFANALLRKIAEHSKKWRNWEMPEKASLKEAAAWASLPEWFWKKMVTDHGQKWSQDFAAACLERPKIWMRTLDSEQPVLMESGAVRTKDGFEEGRFFVQDVSSQRLVQEVSKLAKPGSTVLDLCAAPGGKSIGLAWNGFDVMASDRNDQRMKLLRENSARVGKGKMKVVPKSELAAIPEQDLVWVDAPCSGSGIVRRHPDIRWNFSEKVLVGISRTQRELLEEGWGKLKTGGIFVYSVCSIFKEEGPVIFEEFAKSKGLKVIGQWSFAPQDELAGDGFWGAYLIK